MHARTLPAVAGWRWVGGGFAIFRRNPPLLSMLIVCYWLTIIVLSALPTIGTVAASLAVPGLAVGLMQAARDLEDGRQVGLQTLFGGFRRNPRTLVALGALYLCCTLLVLAATIIVDGGELWRFMFATEPLERAALESGDLLEPVLIAMLLMTPVIMAWWFAPVLAAWHDLGIGRALFFSFVACWMNWRPFLVYGIGLFVVAGLLPGVVVSAIILLVPEARAFATALVTVPMVLVIAPAIIASFYCSYRDIFAQADNA
ncbi:MAG: DUF2189 domain-containing protein [Betaproteobacteria bacterium]|nr:DUF2189 domain-containing protein [Betaproteobacteria bacterium]